MKLVISCLAASACASVTPIVDQPAGQPTHAIVHIDLPAHHAAFPTRLGEPTLPIAATMRDWLGAADHLTARVQLCVAPTGRTVHVALAQTSGNGIYDEAVLTDVSRWRYEPFAASSPRCEPATVTYLP